MSSDDDFTFPELIVDVKEHPEGGHIVTTESKRRKLIEMGGFFGSNKWGEETINQEWLRTDDHGWYYWPEIVASDMASILHRLWDEYRLREIYNPKPEMFKVAAKGNPNRCMFCHSDMSGMAAQCLKCGGAMHLSCADENSDACITPGCSKERV